MRKPDPGRGLWRGPAHRTRSRIPEPPRIAKRPTQPWGTVRRLERPYLHLHRRALVPRLPTRLVYTLVRRFIKTGIAFLFAGLVLGAWMIVRRDIQGIWPHAYLVSAHAHAVLVGFVMFLILGVALWLFPRAPKDDERYRPERAEASYWILLVSTLSRFVAEAARAWIDEPLLGWVVVAGGLGQIVGLAVYFWTMWPRIRPVGSHIREAKGEKF